MIKVDDLSDGHGHRPIHCPLCHRDLLVFLDLTADGDIRMHHASPRCPAWGTDAGNEQVEAFIKGILNNALDRQPT